MVSFNLKSAPKLGKFKNALLTRLDGTSEGAIRTYLGCEIEWNMHDGTTVFSQKRYGEDILRTFGFWDAHPLSTILAPHSPCLNRIVTLHLIALSTYATVALLAVLDTWSI